MYWTDWGDVARIERASMDGSGREVLQDEDLIWPNGLTLDYLANRVYWADAFLDKIEYSNLDGTSRIVLETEENGILHPFSLTLEGDLLFWTEWQNNSIFFTHKILGSTVSTITNNLFVNPNVIEAVTPDRQVDGELEFSLSGFCMH